MSALAGMMAENLGADVRRTIVAAMVRATQGRGTEPFASWGIEDEPVTLGIRQLPTLDLTPDGRQPALSVQKPLAALLDGHIANAAQLRRDLEEAGIKLRGHGDAELLVESVAHVGLNRLLQKLEGAFAFALWDGEARTLHLVRDRMGAKPLYVTQWEGAFAFASDPAAFQVLKGSSGLDESAVAEFLAFGYVPAPKTLRKGVVALPPAHRLMLRPSDTSMPAPEAWWSPLSAVEEIALRGKPANENDTRADRLMEMMAAQSSRLDAPFACLDDGSAGARTLKSHLARTSERTLRTAEIKAPDAVAVQTAFEALASLPLPLANPDAVPLWLSMNALRGNASVVIASCEWAERRGGTTAERPAHLPRPLARAAARLMPQHFAHWAEEASGMLADRLGLWPNIEKLTGRTVEWPIERPRMPMTESDVAAFNAFAGPFRQAFLPMLDILAESMDMEARCPFADHRILEYHWPSPTTSKSDVGGWLRGPLRIRMQNTLDNSIFNLLHLKHSDSILVTWQKCLGGDNTKAHSLWGFLMLAEWAARHGLIQQRL